MCLCLIYSSKIKKSLQGHKVLAAFGKYNNCKIINEYRVNFVILLINISHDHNFSLYFFIKFILYIV